MGSRPYCLVALCLIEVRRSMGLVIGTSVAVTDTDSFLLGREPSARDRFVPTTGGLRARRGRVVVIVGMKRGVRGQEVD